MGSRSLTTTTLTWPSFSGRLKAYKDSTLVECSCSTSPSYVMRLCGSQSWARSYESLLGAALPPTRSSKSCLTRPRTIWRVSYYEAQIRINVTD